MQAEPRDLHSYFQMLSIWLDQIDSLWTHIVSQPKQFLKHNWLLAS